MIDEKDNGVITNYYKDLATNRPITKIKLEKQTVNSLKNVIQLFETPDEQERVTLVDATDMVEVDNYEDLVEENQYWVDYNNPLGNIYFHPAKKAQTYNIKYGAKGYTLISSNKIYTKLDEQGNIVELLSELIEGGREALDTLLIIGSASQVLYRLEEDIANGTETAERLESANTKAEQMHTQVSGDIEVVETFIDDLKTNVEEGKPLNESLKVQNPKAELNLTNLNKAITDCADDIAKINATANGVAIVTTDNWGTIDSDDMYKCVVTHTGYSTDLGLTVYDYTNNIQGETVTVSIKPLTKTTIEVASIENSPIKIVFNSQYYGGYTSANTQTAINQLESSLEENTNKINCMSKLVDNYKYLCPISENGEVEDWHNAIQLLLDEGGTIEFTQFKEYKIKQTLTIDKKRINILGNFATLKYDNTQEESVLFDYVSNQATNIKKSSMKDLTIDCTDKMRRNICINMYGSVHILNSFENIHCINCGIGFKFDHKSFGHQILNCMVTYFYDYGILSLNNSEQFLIDHFWCDYGYRNNLNNTCIEIRDVTSGKISNVVLQNSNYGIKLLGCRPVVLQDIHCEYLYYDSIQIGSNNYQSSGIVIDGIYCTGGDIETARAITFNAKDKYAKKVYGTSIRNAVFINYVLCPIYSSETDSQINTSLINVGWEASYTSSVSLYENLTPALYIPLKDSNKVLLNKILTTEVEINNSITFKNAGSGYTVGNISGNDSFMYTPSYFKSKSSNGFSIRYGDERETDKVIYGFDGFESTGMKIDSNGDLLLLRAGVKIAKVASDGLHLRTGTSVKYDL